MEEDKVKEAMATRLVQAMEPETAKAVLLRVVAGDDLYETILEGGKVGKPEKQKVTRKTRSDKGKSKSTNLPRVPEPPVI